MYSRPLTEHEIQKWCFPDSPFRASVTAGEFTITRSFLPKGEETTLISLRNSMLRGEDVRQIKFTQDCYITRLLTREGGGQLMSDSPQERYEVVPAIKACRGNVLVGGLGLGMYVQMLHKNTRVRHITVVELEPDIISLVAPSLPEGVRVIQADLFQFVANCNWSWNNAIYDIWSPTSEGSFFGYVMPLRLASARAGLKSQKHIFCWAETEMFGQVVDSLCKAAAMPDYWWPYNIFKRGLEQLEELLGKPVAAKMNMFKSPNELPHEEWLTQEQAKLNAATNNRNNPIFMQLVHTFIMDIGSKNWHHFFGQAWDKQQQDKDQVHGLPD